MNNNEKRLSEYIDTLNAEKKPREHEELADSPELEELFHTVRMVRSLKEPTLPEKDFQARLTSAVTDSLPNINNSKDISEKVSADSSKKVYGKRSKRGWMAVFASVAAVVALVILINYILPIFPLGRTNIVHAMEKAYNNIKAYHGFLEVVERNLEGNDTIQSRIEVWANKEGHYYVKGIEGFQKGLITVNNGQKKWQIRPQEQELLLFPAYPDPYRFMFEIGSEVEEIKNAPETVIVGEDIISGRLATIIEVKPEGGIPYRIWVDKETNLPLQKQTAMHNSLQYKVTYTEIEFIDEIPAELVSYSIPEDYKEIDTNPVQFVNTFEEACEIAGFTPRIPKNIPSKYEMDSIAVGINDNVITFYFTQTDERKNRVVILQGKSEEHMKPASTSVLGKIGEKVAEIQSPVQGNFGILGAGTPYAGITDITSIRWQQDGFEYAVIGNDSIDLLSLFVESITGEKLLIPSEKEDMTEKPEVEVAVDLEAEKNDQISVDGGHSPWKLDPVYVAQVFVSLKISPEGIQGDYPVDYEDLEVLKNDGKEAIILVKEENSPISKVYLKRLIRQDNTGIWTVVGYDSNRYGC